METSLPTRGQLERNLSQSIYALYATELGHRPAKVTSHLFADKLAIVVEQSVTPPEQLLANNGQEDLAAQVRLDLEKALAPKLKQLIQETIAVEVIDLLSDAHLETGRTGIIAILTAAPQMRQAADRSRFRRKHFSSSEDSDAPSEAEPEDVIQSDESVQ